MKGKLIFNIAIVTAALNIIVVTTAESETVRFEEPQEKVIIVQKTVPFTYQEYDPPYELPPVPNEAAASYTTPESTVAGVFSAMIQEDNQWLGKMLTEEAEKNVKLKQSKPKEWQEQAKNNFDRLFRDRRIVLTHRIQIEEVLLVRYSSFVKETGEPIIHLKFALRYESGMWKIAKEPETRAFYAITFDVDLNKDVIRRDRPMTTFKPLTIKNSFKLPIGPGLRIIRSK